MIEILYFANPMCSWCWGFSPVLRQLQEHYQDQTKFTLITGSLGDRGSKPMTGNDRAKVRQHWQHVVELTGQPFDFLFFDRETFVYDTEKPSRAVGIVRSVYPALSLPFFAHLQERFYAHNEDITDLAVLQEAAGNFDVEGEVFARQFANPAVAEGIQKEWQQTASFGVSGYPTLLAVKDGKPGVLTIGYRPYEQVLLALQAIMDRAGAVPARG